MAKRYILIDKWVYDTLKHQLIPLEEVVEQLNLYEDNLESTAKFLRKIAYCTEDLACKVMESQAKYKGGCE